MIIKFVTGDCGHPVTNLVYFQCTNFISDIRLTYRVINHTLLCQGYYMSTHIVF